MAAKNRNLQHHKLSDTVRNTYKQNIIPNGLKNPKVSRKHIKPAHWARSMSAEFFVSHGRDESRSLGAHQPYDTEDQGHRVPNHRKLACSTIERVSKVAARDYSYGLGGDVCPPVLKNKRDTQL